MIKKFFLSMGIFTIIAVCFIYVVANMKYQNEWVTYKPDLESRLENSSDCYLCGENSKSLMGYYRNYGDLLLVYFQPGIYGRPIYLTRILMRLDQVV